jgi:hypothetical protein
MPHNKVRSKRVMNFCPYWVRLGFLQASVDMNAKPRKVINGGHFTHRLWLGIIEIECRMKESLKLRNIK